MGTGYREAVDGYYGRLLGLDAAELARELKRDVVGQDDFIDRFCPQFCAMARRLALVASGADPDTLPRLGSALVAGTTASGKTFVAKRLARAAGVYAHVVDCSTLTGSGWHGNGVEEELRGVAELQRAHPGMPIAVIWDEADKMAYGTDGADRSFNAQRNFLKFLEGGRYRLNESKEGGAAEVDADLVINVFLGCFDGIERIVRKRLGAGPACGFASGAASAPDDDALRADVTAADLIEWGMSGELVGRIGPIEGMPSLSEDDLARVVKGSGASLELRYGKLCGDGCDFEISDMAARLLAREAAGSGLGARALESMLAPVASAAVHDAVHAGAGRVLVHVSDGRLGYRIAFRHHPSDPPDRPPDFARALARRCRESRDEDAEGGREQSMAAIGRAFEEQRLDLAYFLDAGRGIDAVARCIASKVDGERWVPREFAGAYGESAARALLHMQCEYDRRYRQIEQLYYFADIASTERAVFDAMLEGEPPDELDARIHRRSARELKAELDRVSPDVLYREAAGIAALLRECSGNPEKARDLADAIKEALPPARPGES